MRQFVQIAGWGLLLAIAALSISPPAFRSVTAVPHALEHLAIFLAVGLAFGLSRPHRYLLLLEPI